jgi:aspartate-semialdehyde dehydrogenase
MSNKIKVGILGCTGMVGQKLIVLLDQHPLFAITEITASESSAGKPYADAVNWKEGMMIPASIKNLKIKKSNAELDTKILFSALDAEVAGTIEEWYARQGYVVVSNSKNHRMDDDVPLIIPEINARHLALITKQKQRYKSEGFIVTNPNCAAIIMVKALFPIQQKFGLKEIIVTTMQAISGAGYPGVSAIDILGNVIPHIQGEEEKMQTEPLKIFGKYVDGKIEFADLKISAMCNRVPVYNGHTMAISFATRAKANKQDIQESFNEFDKVLRYFADPFRPQPALDVNTGNGMAISMGNLRKCAVLDWKLTTLGHNTICGAAGAAIANAEYLVANKFI